MAKTKIKKNKLSIFLLKEGLSEAALVDAPESVFVEGVGNFYYKNSASFVPPWVKKFFGEGFVASEALRSSSASGLLVVPVSVGGKLRHFALSFGYGRFLLKPGAFEQRFGLRVVLNSVEPESLRSIDKTTLGSVPKHSREQMTREVSAAAFGIEVDQDLISSVTARSKDPVLGKTITGGDALTVSVPVASGDIGPFLQHCYERYQSPDYKKEFGWVDQILELRDSATAATLNDLLVGRLKAKQFDKIWMAVPETIEWNDVDGFQYSSDDSEESFDDLDIKDFLATIDPGDLSVETMKNVAVIMKFAGSGAEQKWMSYSCIYAEIETNGHTFILNNGQWYEIDTGFATQVAKEYKAVRPATIAFPDFTAAKELEYNEAVAAKTGMCCMDQKNIVYGGGGSRVEFCDLLTSSKQLIHVKRYGGSSSLSHLFAQGVVSAELFAGERGFRELVNQKLPDSFKLADTAERPSGYEIIYAIVSDSKSPLDIPFFSKVSLRNACRRLRVTGYDVSLAKIQRVTTDPSAN